VRDPYKFLGVPYDVTMEALRKRYHELALKLHADTGGSDEMMKLINEAKAQIEFNLKHNVRFDPNAQTGPEPESDDDRKRPDGESRKEDDRRSQREEKKRPEEEASRWGPTSQTWDVGGERATYSNIKYRDPRRTGLMISGVAFVVLALAIVGPRSCNSDQPHVVTVPTTPPPLSPVPSPPSAQSPVFTGYLDKGDLDTSHSIAPGQVFGFSFPPGRMQIVVLSGQVQLMSPDRALIRGCSDESFFVEFGQFVARAPLVTPCNGSVAVLMALGSPPPKPADQFPTPQAERPPDGATQTSTAAERDRQANDERRRREDEAQAERRRREQQAEQDELDRIARNQRLEDARRQAAEARGCKYQGNGISVCPGKGY
jgi:hypothetical protein